MEFYQRQVLARLGHFSSLILFLRCQVARVRLSQMVKDGVLVLRSYSSTFTEENNIERGKIIYQKSYYHSITEQWLGLHFLTRSYSNASKNPQCLKSSVPLYISKLDSFWFLNNINYKLVGCKNRKPEIIVAQK